MAVPILKQGPYLIASIQAAMTDSDVLQLREEWARRITDAELLTAMSQEEIFSEATSVYDN